MSLLARKPKTVDLRDVVLTESIGSDRIDREAGTIKHVKVLGRVSQNGREYSDRAIQDACRLYESQEVNINHPDRKDVSREREMIEGWGVLRECKVESDGVYANLDYLREHYETPVILERIERGFPIGLSHNARGAQKKRRGRNVIESIAQVRGVDLVRRPATNKDLFESEDQETMTLRELIESTGYKHTTALLEMLPEEVPADAEVAAPEEGEDATQGVVKALAQEAAKVIENPDIDSGETLAKVKSIVKTVENVKKDLGPETPAPEGEGDEGECDDEDKKVVESLQATVAELQAKQTTSDLLEEYGVTRRNLRPDQREALSKLSKEKDVRDFCESLPPAYRGQQLQTKPAGGGNGAPKRKHVPLNRMRRRG